MTDTIEAVARAIDPEAWAHDLPIPTRADTVAFHDRRQRSNSLARIAIAAHTEALLDGAGEVERYFEGRDEMEANPNGDWCKYDQAAATIAALRAEIERAKLDGVRAGIALTAEAAMTWAKECAPEYVEHLEALGHSMIRALSPATIAADAAGNGGGA